MQTKLAHVVGIVGNSKNKFTPKSESIARDVIRRVLTEAMNSHDTVVMCSGHSPAGGIDIWAEEVATELGIALDLKIPKQHRWDAPYGYKARNLDIASTSDEIHVILVSSYPPSYHGQRFNYCYHCHTDTHVKSGGCWTGLRAVEMGKDVYVHVIKVQ